MNTKAIQVDTRFLRVKEKVKQAIIKVIDLNEEDDMSVTYVDQAIHEASLDAMKEVSKRSHICFYINS